MSSLDASDIPPLAVQQTVVKIFADYVKYLFDCSRSYIKETHANGASLWQSVEKTIDYVFSHPNRWEGPQQTQMRQAAVQAGLISDDEKGHSRISFVTEGEASLHFCINSGLSTQGIVKVRIFVRRLEILYLTTSAAKRRYCDCRCWRRHHRHQLLSWKKWQVRRNCCTPM